MSTENENTGITLELIEPGGIRVGIVKVFAELSSKEELLDWLKNDVIKKVETALENKVNKETFPRWLYHKEIKK